MEIQDVVAHRAKNTDRFPLRERKTDLAGFSETPIVFAALGRRQNPGDDAMSLNHGSGGVLGRIVLVCGALTASAGALILVLWAFGRESLTAMRTGYIPMAPNSALLFALLGSAVVIREVWPASRAIRRAVAAVALFSAVLAGVTLIGFAIDLNIDDLFFRTTRMLGKVPIGKMSPVTAFCFALAGVSLLLLEYQVRTWAAILGTLITLVGSVCLIGYWFGAPLFYGGTLIPVALPTSLALVALGAGLTAAAGPHTWPLNILIGPSTRARFLRALLPTVVLLALLKDWISTILLGHSGFVTVLAATVTAISFLLVVSCVVFWVSRVIGDALDRAEAERKQAERQLHLLSAALHASANAIMITDIEGNVQWVNPAFTALTGYSTEEVVGKNPRQLVKSGTHDQAFYKNLWDTILAGEIWHGETINRRKDGSLYTEDQTISPARNDRGEITHFIAIKQDITDRKRADDALKLFRTLIEQSNDAIEVIDPETGRFLDVNEKDCTNLGYSRNELLSLRVSDIAPTVDQSAWPKLMEELRKSKVMIWEGIHRRKDGSTFPVEVNIKYVQLDRDYIIAAVRDITERKRAEETSRESSEKLRALFEFSPLAIIAVAPTDKVLMWNPAAERLFGWRAEEIIGRPLLTIPPEDRDEYLQALASADTANGIEVKRLHKDGSVIDAARWTAKLHSTDGKLFCVIGMFIDIRARKRAEEALVASELRNRHLLNSSPSVIYATTIIPPHHCTFVSDTLTRMTGYAPQMMLDDPGFWRSRVHPEDLKQIKSEIKRLLADGEGTLEYRFCCQDGEYHWIRDAFRVIYDSNDRRNEMVGAWTDITTSRHMEQQLAQAQKMEAVGQLTGGVAHDFNNRLTVILGNLELLERKLRDDFAASALLKAALSATIGAAELTRRLLTFSRQQVLESSLININELVAGMYDMLQRSLGETINIVMSPGQNLWLVMTDRHMLENVLLNLAVNARDAMPAGGQLTIETSNIALDETYVETHAYAISGDHVLLAVSDTGLGMSEEVKRHAFEPFFTTKGEGKGTGLGLSMVYGFVKQSGGHVEIYSEPGHGTSFKIYLPRAGSAADVASETPARDTGDEDAAMHGKTILLVEDDETVREIGVTLLTDMGCRVLIADSGLAALKLFRSHPEIDLLFTDMKMPGGMTGVDLAARLRERLPELRVLYTSGYAPQAAADRRTIEHPNDFWLAKPYRLQAFRDAVRRALGEKSDHFG
jgi:PAS domain S-box-containing protein